MSTFLTESNVCGWTLLRLASRGNAIIAELLRLSQHIPSVFYLSSATSNSYAGDVNNIKYKDVLFDFKYINNSDECEEAIQSNISLMEIDEEFRENHIHILNRFYILFENIYKYYIDVSQYISDLEAGVYIQHTFEGVLLNEDGRQLLCEVIYLYGTMLLLLDHNIDGIVRERMLMAIYRYKGSAETQNIDHVCKLLRATGYKNNNLNINPAAGGGGGSGGKELPPTIPKNYPDDYFQRFSFPEHVLLMILGRLRSDDIYNGVASFPSPHHRSFAYANQASLVYIILYFLPDHLHNNKFILREIVDKFFNDNWVISYYMGYYHDLFIHWSSHAAALDCLNNVITEKQIKDLHGKYILSLPPLHKELRMYLSEGYLAPEYVLDHIPALLTCLRNCNVSLRWLILHRQTFHKKLKPILLSSPSNDDIITLLLDTAQYEFLLKKLFEDLLVQKPATWLLKKDSIVKKMDELGEYYSGKNPLARNLKDNNLEVWFVDIARKIEGLDYNDSIVAGRKIQQIIKALTDVEEFHQISSSIMVQDYLGKIRLELLQMVRTANIKEETMISLSVISDMSYAWMIINNYLTTMHQRIKNKPSSCLLMRSLFLKLASIMDAPLDRIKQANSDDLHSVAEYYSGELIHFIRQVLEIVPISMFHILNNVIVLQTNNIIELPTKLPRIQLKQFSQLEQRHELAKLTHQISIFTSGILAMEATLVGIIEVFPQQLLEDGIRKELVKNLSKTLHDGLQFTYNNNKLNMMEFEKILLNLSKRMSGFLKSFEYIQDYLHVYGLKIWQEEYSRIIEYNIEQECNSFLKKKIYDWQSKYQSLSIPIPFYNPTTKDSITFLGRLARELICHTDTGMTNYNDAMNAWLDGSGKEIIGLRTFGLLHKSIGIFGLRGLNKLFSFMIVSELSSFIKLIKSKVDRPTQDHIQRLKNFLGVASTIPDGSTGGGTTLERYDETLKYLKRLFIDIILIINKIGQYQLIKNMISNELNFSAKLDSNMLACCLENVNHALLKDVRSHYRHPDKYPYPGIEAVNDVDENDPSTLPLSQDILNQLSEYVEASGINSPLTKIYITTEPIDNIAMILFLLVLSQTSKLTFNHTLSSLINVRKNTSIASSSSSNAENCVDGPPFAIGLLTTIRQFHSSQTHAFLSLAGQYVRCCVNSSFTSKDAAPSTVNVFDTNPSVSCILIVLQEFCKVGQLDRKIVEGYVPAYIFDTFHKAPVGKDK